MRLTETHPAVRPPAPARPVQTGRQPLSFGLNKALVVGIVTALLGTLATVAPWIAGTQTDLESAAGLRILYALRGVREPPREIVIVLIDQTTLDEPDFPDLLGEWSRALHAQLLRRLEAARPGVVAFDFHFNKARDMRGDREFAQAIKDTGNVLLIEYLIPARSAASTQRRSRLPIRTFADVAAMVVPFLLPDGRDCDQLLLRDPAGENLPTLPLAALLVYSKPYLETLEALLRATLPALPEIGGQLGQVNTRHLTTVLHQLHTQFGRYPELADHLNAELTRRANVEPQTRAALMALIDAVRTLEARHIDYYGPPGTVTTLPYQCIMQGGCDAFPPERFSSLHGKAVFVGFSDLRHGSVMDRFPTVYGNFSGVEIGATAFANLLERRSLRPLPVLWHLCIVALWAALLGRLATTASTGFAMCGILALSAAYSSAVYLAFAHFSLWLPLAVPIAIQVPLAAAMALLRGYLEERRARERNEHELARLEDGLRVYLPGQVVESIARNTPDLSSQIMYGVCIHSDAGQFTLLSETMKAVPLRTLLNCYYEPLFDAVKKHDGWVSDVIGDAMLAVWPTAATEPKAKRAACDAALEIIRAIAPANPHCLSTRVGIHCGELVLGNVGARGRFEYRAVGEVVNKTERIERANKRLGTRILASHDVTSGIEGLLTREVGSFYLPGTSRAVVLCEIVNPDISTLGSIEHMHRYFNAALTAFKLQDFDQAQQIFETLLKEFGDDGPARFYLDLCRQFATLPPKPPWTGCVRF